MRLFPAFRAWLCSTPDTTAAATPENTANKKPRPCFEEAESPLKNSETLHRILELLGTKAWLYVAINRQWRGEYLSICRRIAKSKGEEFRYLTSWQNAVITAPRLRMALECGITDTLPDILDEDSAETGEYIVQHSSDAAGVFTLCKLHDMPWLCSFAVQAVHKKDFPLLQWLIVSGCFYHELEIIVQVIDDLPCESRLDAVKWLWAQASCFDEYEKRHILKHAIRCSPQGSRLKIIKWVWTQNPALCSSDVEELLDYAGTRDDIETVQYIMSIEKCSWPKAFWHEEETQAPVDFTADPVRGELKCWGPRSLACARELGAEWGDWRCERFNEGWYDEGLDAQFAREVFDWGHNNGCPCTCEL